MGFETLLLLCDMLRRPGAFSVCLCVCRACSFTGGVALSRGTGGAREAEQILARAFQ